MSLSSSVSPPREELESNAPREERSSGDGRGDSPSRPYKPPPSSRRQLKPTSLWFCANESCSFHDHLTPLAAKDAKRSQPGGDLFCPQCNAATLVPANEYNLPPWYDHKTARKNLGHPVEPTFPDVPSSATSEGEKA